MLLSTGDDPPTATLTLGHGRIRSVGSELDLHGLVRGAGGREAEKVHQLSVPTVLRRGPL